MCHLLEDRELPVEPPFPDGTFQALQWVCLSSLWKHILPPPMGGGGAPGSFGAWRFSVLVMKSKMPPLREVASFFVVAAAASSSFSPVQARRAPPRLFTFAPSPPSLLPFLLEC